MRKFTLLLLCLISIINVNAQGLETFDGLADDSGSSTSYLSREFIGQDGSTWTATNARKDQTIDGIAITLNDDKVGTYLQSGTLTGGIGDLTLSTQRKYSGGSGDLDVYVNNTLVGTVPYGTDVLTTTITGINVSGDFVLKFGDTSLPDRIAIDNITWTPMGQAASCSISNLNVNAVCNGDDVEVTITYNAVNGTTQEASIDGGLNFYPITSGQVITITGPKPSVTGNIIVRDTDTTNNPDCLATMETTLPACPEEAPIIMITEIMADPGTAMDSNRDGVMSSTEDEYVELFNTTDSSIDISGWTLSDNNSVRHTFADGTVIEAGKFYTVFGGGTVAGVYSGSAIVATSGSLGLNNSGDVVTLTESSIPNVTGRVLNNVIDSQTYNDAPKGESLAVDENGDLVPQSTLNGEVESINTFNTAAPLPVEFTSFTAEDKGSYRLLRWSTALEINNDRFEVEVSENGLDYVTVGTVEGSATSSVENTYSFEDKSLVSGAVVYYRLKQVDFDGLYDYSEVVTVELSNIAVAVYPNPVTNELTVKGAGNFRVYDLFGREVENIMNTNAVYQLNTTNYEVGTYILLFENGTSVRFTKM